VTNHGGVLISCRATDYQVSHTRSGCILASSTSVPRYTLSRQFRSPIVSGLQVGNHPNNSEIPLFGDCYGFLATTTKLSFLSGATSATVMILKPIYCSNLTISS
jgi:hypothetical protein